MDELATEETDIEGELVAREERGWPPPGRSRSRPSRPKLW